MFKKTVALIAVLALLLTGLSPVQAQIQTTLPAQGESATVRFPYYIDFNLLVNGGATITDVRLHYTVERDSFANVTSEVKTDILPGTTVNATWTWDLRQTGSMPSGTEIDYWWTIEDSTGNSYVTEKERVSYDDSRFTWQKLTEGNITLYYYYGGESFARELLTSAEQSLAKLAADTGASLQKPIRVYIYADSSDLQGAMIFAQDWTGGVAYSREGAIAIGINPDNMAWGRRAIAHELAHLVTEQMTSNPYNSIPIWLNEGISVYAEGDIDPMYTSYLRRAVASGSLISVRSLSGPFPADADKTYLSYAESRSLVGFLIDTYGRAKMFQLLSIFKQGSTYDGAFMSVYGFDIDGLNTLWQAYAIKNY
jgi:hypothetical protein